MVKDTVRTVPLEPMAVSIDEAARLIGSSRSGIYRAIRGGDLRAVKLGRNTRILTDSLRSRVASLPSLVGGKVRA